MKATYLKKIIADVVKLSAVVLFFWSIPYLFKKNDLKGGSVIVKAIIVDIASCPKLDECFYYEYQYAGKTYSDRISAYKGPKIGDILEVVVSLNNPENSYRK